MNAELKILEAARLLERLPPAAGDRRVFLRPVESPYWETCRALVAQATASVVAEPSTTVRKI